MVSGAFQYFFKKKLTPLIIGFGPAGQRQVLLERKDEINATVLPA